MKKSKNKDFLRKVTDQNAFQICNFDQQTILMFSVHIFLTCHKSKHNDMFSYKYKPKSRYSYHSLGFSLTCIIHLSIQEIINCPSKILMSLQKSILDVFSSLFRKHFLQLTFQTDTCFRFPLHIEEKRVNIACINNRV